MLRWLLVGVAVALVTPAARAQSLEDYDYEYLSFRGLGLEYGRVFPKQVESAAVYTLRFDLGYLGPYVRISPSFGYWSSQVRGSELDRLAEQLRNLGADISAAQLGPIDWSDFSMSVDGHAVWSSSLAVAPYVGLGLGVHALNGRGPAIDGTFIEDLLDTVTAGASGVLGVEVLALEGFKVYGELRYTILSDLRYRSLHLGGAFVLPSRSAAESPR